MSIDCDKLSTEGVWNRLSIECNRLSIECVWNRLSIVNESRMSIE